MKFKLTSQFLMSIFIIVIVVFFVNAAILLGYLFYQSKKGLNDMSEWSGEDFTRSFTQFINIENGTPVVSNEGLQQLQKRNAWIQFLDEGGQVINSYFTPNDSPSHYSPIELIHTYKYREDTATTIYVSSVESISFLIGIKDTQLGRVVFTFDIRSILEVASTVFLLIIVVDLIIAALIGLLFSSILTRPVSYMIERIEKLKQLDYATAKPKKTGIYRNVFDNLNDVSETLEKHEEERQKLEKMRTEWISNVSHDMKTPLASIRGYAELLQDQVTDNERREYVSVIERQSKYMSELLEDFNFTMKLRNNRIELQRTAVNLPTFIREMVIDLLNDVQFQHRHIEFNTAMEQLAVEIDPHLIKRALLNFIYNALHHNDDDTIVTIGVDTDAHGNANITIADNGKGINDEDSRQVFERYYRGSNTEDIQGTGLGMAIARDIIEAHSGQVTLESELDKGTTIRIILSKE